MRLIYVIYAYLHILNRYYHCKLNNNLNMINYELNKKHQLLMLKIINDFFVFLNDFFGILYKKKLCIVHNIKIEYLNFDLLDNYYLNLIFLMKLILFLFLVFMLVDKYYKIYWIMNEINIFYKIH